MAEMLDGSLDIMDRQQLRMEIVRENSSRLQVIGLVGLPVNLLLVLFLDDPSTPASMIRIAWILASIAFILLVEYGKRHILPTLWWEAVFTSAAALSLLLSAMVSSTVFFRSSTLVFVINLMLTGTLLVLDPPRILLIYGPSTVYMALYIFLFRDHMDSQGTGNLVNAAVTMAFMFCMTLVRWHDRRSRFVFLQEIRRRAETDGLTGLANRQRLDGGLDFLGSLSCREGFGIAALMVDVDDFKLYNDTFGHLAGDEALKSIARCLKSSVRRPSDLVGRYGGEEFLILLAGTDLGGAAHVARKAREAVQALAREFPGSPHGVVTISIGVALGLPGPEGSPGYPLDVVARADSALYAAKRAGKNRVHCDGE